MLSRLTARGRRRRWAEENRYFGPFTWSPSSRGYTRWGLMLDSGGSHESSRNEGCHLRLYLGANTLLIELPRLLPDYRIKHVPQWDAETVARLGRDHYYEVFPREFGAYAAEDALHVHYGPQTFSSDTTRSKVLWIPWRQWRFIRQSWYGLAGEHLRTDFEGGPREIRSERWESQREFEQQMPKAVFEFDDYDGKRIRATTHIEEREWRLGAGLFRWLSLFVKPRIRRSLDIDFSEEVGPEKGSWKGGTTGHSIDMLPGELHEQAFRRYCEQEHRSKYQRFRITFVGRVFEAV